MRGNHFLYLLFLFTLFSTTMTCDQMTNNSSKQTPLLTMEQGINQTVTLVKGQLPLIISVPHGSLNLPNSIPNRTEGQLIADAYTIMVANQLARKIQQQYKLAPYLVVFNVARRKVDVNRPMEEGCESPEGRQVWKYYHSILQETVNSVKKQYGHGLLLDIHGQAHKEGMVELGYLLSAKTLRSSNSSDINDSTLTHQSSIQLLSSRLEATNSTTTSSLLRGNGSFGYAMTKNGNPQHSIKVVPSPDYPYPNNGTLYFSGGYTTKRHHTTLDVIQVESPKALRFSKEGRKLLTDSLADAAIFMLDHYYLSDRSKL